MRKVFLITILALLFLSTCASRKYMVASWYGPDFHGKLTASGDVYNMFDHTAAHKTLSLGTRLKITNPDNGKSTHVIINDRGPFIRGRDIDLSYQAAKDIGLISHGTGIVKVEYIGRDGTYKEYKSNMNSVSGPFTLQIASFINYSYAINLKKGLQSRFNKVYIKEEAIDGRSFYRVRIGMFDSKEEANMEALRIAEKGYGFFIVGF